MLKKSEKDCAAIRRFLHENLDRPDDSKMLYQYSDIRALQGFVKNTEFHANHYRYLNDRNEFDHGLGYAIEFAKNHYDKYRGSFTKSFLERFRYINEDCREWKILPFPKVNVYTRSFSAREDLLSQWRGYGNRYRSVCMGFSKDALEMSVKAHNQTCILRKVVYDQDKQRTLVNAYMNKCCLVFEKYLEDFIHDPAYFEKNARGFTIGLIQMILCFKEDCWKEEEEWRVIAMDYGSGIDFKESAFGLVPFLKIPVDLSVLKTVTLPKSEYFIHSKKSLGMFLSQYEELSHVDIKQSNISIVY
jgi:hypothetical protein